MILALLLAAAEPAPVTAIDAERAFAADAQKIGQWTAFRNYATDDASMFVPHPVKAQEWLKDRKDPPVSVFWWPGRSYVSCDGSVAVNTGPWVRGYGKSVGYFTTVWLKQPDGRWKWVYDAGDELKAARAEGGDIRPVIASCKTPRPPMPHSSGASKDGTLNWSINLPADGSRGFFAYLWNGSDYVKIVEDLVPAPPK